MGRRTKLTPVYDQDPPAQLPSKQTTLPRAFLVSLRRTPHRTTAGVEALRPLGLRLEVVPACDGSSAEGHYLPRDPRTKYMMQPGEVGICGSFLKVCSLIVRDDLPWGIYFEDDVEVLRTEGMLEAFQSLPDDFHFANLHDAKQPAPVFASETAPEPWQHVKNPSFVTVAYLISNAGARAALRGIPPFDRPLDVWLRDNPLNLNIYQVHPDKAWFAQNFWQPSTARKINLPGTIPKIIHRVWLGDKPIPDDYEAYWQTWIDHHPGYEFRTHRDFAGYMGMPEGLGPAAQSDFVRLHVLLKHGGLYVDTDFECFHSFDRLLQTGSLLVAEESPGVLCNGLMAGSPNHQLIKAMLDQAPERTRQGMEILHAAGPGLVRHVVDGWRNKWVFPLREGNLTVAHRHADTGIVIIDCKALFPYYWAQPKPSSYGNAWAAHHWGRSWWTPEMWTDFYLKNPHLCPE